MSLALALLIAAAWGITVAVAFLAVAQMAWRRLRIGDTWRETALIIGFGSVMVGAVSVLVLLKIV